MYKPTLDAQDIVTKVFGLPPGTTLSRVSELLTGDCLRSCSMERAHDDQLRDTIIPGQRFLRMFIQAPDLLDRYRFRWSGSADLSISYYEEHEAPGVTIRVSSHSSEIDEQEFGRTARAAWRLGDVIERVFKSRAG